VVSWPTTFGFDALLPLAELTAFYREYNDRLGELLARHPDRFSGLAAVPVLDPQSAAAELARAQAACGTIGAVIPADAFLTEAGAELYRPLLAQAQALRSHLYVHPGPTGLTVPAHVPVEFLRTDKGSARWLLESGTRLGAAALTLETSPLLGGYPAVTIHVSMRCSGRAGSSSAPTSRSSAPAGRARPSGTAPCPPACGSRSSTLTARRSSPGARSRC
jgi:hypothetical protein